MISRESFSAIHSPNGRALNGKVRHRQGSRKGGCLSRKVMLIALFDVYEIVRIQFLPLGQTINQNVFNDILRRLMRLVLEKRKEL